MRLTAFYFRYLIYALCILTFIVTFFIASLYWYVEENKWLSHGQGWFECAVQHILFDTMDQIENDCENLKAPGNLQIIAFVGTMPILIGGWVLQMTESSKNFWIVKFQSFSTMLFDLSMTNND